MPLQSLYTKDYFLLLRFFYLFILIFIYFVYNVETTPIRKEREWMWTLALPPSHGVTNACPKSLPVLAHAYGSTEVLATCRLILAYGLVLKSPTGCHVSSDSIVLLLAIDSNSINRKEECWCLIKWKGQPTWRSVGP